MLITIILQLTKHVLEIHTYQMLQYFLFCSTLNLACECLKPDFSRQLRAHGLVNKILVLLKDALEHPVSPMITTYMSIVYMYVLHLYEYV